MSALEVAIRAEGLSKRCQARDHGKARLSSPGTGAQLPIPPVAGVRRRPGQGDAAAPTQPADTDTPVRQFGDLTIDPAAREALVAGTPVELTRLEFDLLDVLSARPRVAFSRRQLVEHVWDEAWVGDAPVIPLRR